MYLTAPHLTSSILLLEPSLPIHEFHNCSIPSLPIHPRYGIKMYSMWSVVVLWEVCGGLGWFAVVWVVCGNSMVPAEAC